MSFFEGRGAVLVTLGAMTDNKQNYHRSVIYVPAHKLEILFVLLSIICLPSMAATSYTFL
jgi:hypothetical protein